MDEKDESGAWQGIKGKINEAVGDATDNPEKKEKGRLQQEAARGKEADTRLQDRERRRL